MKRLLYFLSLLLIVNVYLSASISDVQRFVDVVVSDENELIKEAKTEIDKLLNEVGAEFKKEENFELKELFEKSYNTVSGVNKYKDHHKRELKKNIEKLNSSLIEESRDELTRGFPTKDKLLEKMQKLNAALYAILQDGSKKLNETTLDDILDIIYHLPTEFAEDHKKLVITSSVVTTILITFLIYKYKKSAARDAVSTESNTPPYDSNKRRTSGRLRKRVDRLGF